MARIIEEAPPRRPAYFWWLLANALAACLALVSWLACLHVFHHPEIPWNYEILGKIKRLPVIRSYPILEAPDAKSLSPRDLYKKFNTFDTDPRLANVNSALMRNYLMNFKRPLMINYVEGNFRVESVRPLGEGDFFSHGFVVRGRAMVKPDDFSPVAPYPVMVDYLFPTSNRAAFSWFKPGDMLPISKSPNCAVVLNLAKVEEKDEQGGVEHILCVTVMPIVYSRYQVGDDRSFGLETPERFNPGAKFPLFK